MTNPGMEGFKKQLKALKSKGADIDPDAIIQDLTTPASVTTIEEFENSFDKKVFQILKQKVMKLLDDFEDFYGPKGRGLSIAIHIQKDNSADRYSETFPYTEKLSIVHIVDIGTKDKYEPVVIKIDERMIEEEKKKVEEKEKRLGRK
jgi:hypothetical protein